MEAKRHVLGKSYTNLKFYERPKYFNRNSENLKRFFDEIRKSKYKPFETKEEEDLVVAKAYSGEPGWEKAKEELINRNIRAVVSKARNYASEDESDLSDYISEGVYGLTLAFDSYNPKSGTKFLTYALIYAFKYMNEYRCEKENMVKQANRGRVSSTVGKLAEKFFTENEREPSLTELKELCLENNIRIVNEMDLENVFVESIDITDSNAVLSYGASAQRKVSDFADGALASVRGKDMGETGQVLSSLIVELKSNSEEKQGLFNKLFGSAEKNFERLKAQYSTTEANIDRLVKILEGHEEQLLKDIVQLDKLYDKNKLYFKEVSMYIEAGKLRLEKARNEELPALQAKAKETNSPEDAQAAQDFADMITRFEKKLYDLELSRTVCLQSAPEIRMVQNSDTIMSEKIHSTIINVIPMWKTQMVLALNNYHTQKAIEAQNAVTEATNEMLRKNAEALHQSSVETAKASERGIVDIETLQHTNQELISALDEIIQIQSDGKIARANAEKELARIEQELKDKMLGIAANAGMTAEQLADSQTKSN